LSQVPWTNFVIRRLELAMIKPHTKIEVSTFTHYEDMKNNSKFGWFGFTQSHRQCLHPIEHITSYSTLVDYVPIVHRYRFRVIASYLSKVADFNLPHLHLAPLMWVTRFEFRGDVWRQKTRVRAIMSCCLRDPIFSRFDKIPACDGRTDEHTDKRTDGRTHADS